MSHLNDLIRQLATKDEALARDIEREVAALQDRRAFGLNFERHQPEAVELPGRKVRRGDKVRVLPPRGELPKKTNERLWLVVAIDPVTDQRVASLTALDGSGDIARSLLDDLVVVAEFRDPIYPGLVSTGKVARGGDKPYHSVINAENYHALQALLFTHRGKVDCIYIDPPYNTGAKDWKYNNDYVEGDDLYRHSKWLAFMERRLLLAKELLNPADSVLIVTIDEKEYLRLGMLLEQVFPESKIQMISSVINPKGTARANEFARVEEFVFFVFIGSAKLSRIGDDMLSDRDYSIETEVRWRGLARTGRKGLRPHNPGSWYPIYIDEMTSRIHSIGETVPIGAEYNPSLTPPGTVAIWPTTSGTEQFSWSVVPETLREIQSRGGLKTGNVRLDRGQVPLYYLTFNAFERIESGAIEVVGKDDSGALLIRHAQGARKVDPRSVWNRVSHDAGEHGTKMIGRLIPGRRFPFPKSLYVVEDCLRFFIGTKPSAVVVDFFAGSGTTAQAVMKLNRQDRGSRRCISVTNNEVAAADQASLRRSGFRPGDVEWERHGICDYITKPRIEAAITGKTPAGDPISGDYKFTDEFPMADGFEENVEFFTLTYESPLRIEANREFARIAPLLWLRAGSKGRRIDDLASGWDVAETYGVISDLDHSEEFARTMTAKSEASVAFIITDEDRLFEALVRELPDHVEPVRLYEAYLRTFEIEARRAAER